MCDYILERVASRAAVKGDRLITTNFCQGLTGGFAAENDLNTAVCLLPGTELVFECAPQYGRRWLFWPKIAPSASARFRQINQHNPHCHHDALEFADGTQVLLSKLDVGQRAIDLQLPKTAAGVKATNETDTERQTVNIK